ncbi:MAG: hypothetical protein ABSF77_07370 [Spirochaetia bacterium]|jgi:hypothetical protein
MPLLPIDLQTLFTQSTQVGKEQAAQKNAAPLAQSVQGALLVQKAELRDATVNETHDQEEGPEQVKDRARRGAERRRQKQAAKHPPAVRPPAAAVVQDPALGRNIDITS